MLPSSLRQAWAASCVSASAKKSATSGTRPARRADCASARPEIAAIRSAGCSADELLGKVVSVPEIKIERLFRLDHHLEQTELGFVLDVADGGGPRYRLAVVVDADALDA